MIRAAALCLLLGGCASDLASVALRYEGKTARDLGLPGSLWCGDFASLVRREAGASSVRSRRAIDQTQGARRLRGPERGALMITRRGASGHHVDIVVEVLPDGLVRVIGGNVAGAVRERVLPASGAIFVRPS